MAIHLPSRDSLDPRAFQILREIKICITAISMVKNSAHHIRSEKSIYRSDNATLTLLSARQTLSLTHFRFDSTARFFSTEYALAFKMRLLVVSILLCALSLVDGITAHPDMNKT